MWATEIVVHVMNRRMAIALLADRHRLCFTDEGSTMRPRISCCKDVACPCGCRSLQEAVGERYILMTCQPGAIEDVAMYDV